MTDTAAAASAAPPQAPAAPPPPLVGSSAEDRAVDLRTRLAEQDAAEGQPAPGDPPADKAPASPPTQDEIRASRKTRMEAAAAQLRKEEDARRARAARRQPPAAPAAPQGPTVDQLRAELEAERGKKFRSEVEFMDAAEAAGLDAFKLGKLLSARMSDPAAIAKQEAAARVADANKPLLDRIDAMEKREKDRQDAAEKQRLEAEHGHAEAQAQTAFLAFAKERSNEAPIVAQLLDAGQEQWVITQAYGLLDKIPESAGLQGLLDSLEDTLQDELRRQMPLYERVKPHLGGSAPTPATSRRQAPPERSVQGAGNRAASERSGVVDTEEAWRKASVDERAEMLKDPVFFKQRYGG